MSNTNLNRPISEIIEYLKTEKIIVSVFGEFSSGKTTFLNALINEEILTVAYEPTTAVPTRIRYGKLFNILVYKNNDEIEPYFKDGQEETIWRRIISRRTGANILSFLENQKTSIQNFMKMWTKEGEKANQVKEVIIELPLEWLINKIELIDTPGTNNEYTEHRKFTENIALDTDIAIMLLDGTHGGASKTEYEFMNQVNKVVHNSLIVVNKMDLVDSVEEYDDVMNYLKNDSIPKHWEHTVNPKIFGLSSKLQLTDVKIENAAYLKTVFNSFIGELKTLIEKNRGSILLERLGNPEKEILREARKLSKSEEVAEIHTALDKYDDLRNILIAAGLSTKSVENGIERIEQEQRKRFSSIEENKNLFNELKGQEDILNIHDYYKKMTSLKNDMNTLGFKHAESDDEIHRIKEKLEKIESDGNKINSLLNTIDSLLETTNYDDYSIPDAKNILMEIETVWDSKYFADDLKKRKTKSKRNTNNAIKRHIKFMRDDYSEAIKESDFLKKAVRINKMYKYYARLCDYNTIKEYQVYINKDGKVLDATFQELEGIARLVNLEKRLDTIKYFKPLLEWESDFNDTPENIAKTKRKRLFEKFEVLKEKIQKYDNYIKPKLEKINQLISEPITSLIKLQVLNNEIVLPGEFYKDDESGFGDDRSTIFLDYFDFFEKSQNRVLNILNINEKVGLVSHLVKATKGMEINQQFVDTKDSLESKSKFFQNNYFTTPKSKSQFDSLGFSIGKLGLLKYNHENPIFLFLENKYFCRKCGKKYASKYETEIHSKACRIQFSSQIFEKSLYQSIPDTKLNLTKIINVLNGKKLFGRDNSSIDLLWEISKKLNDINPNDTKNQKILESFYNIPFSKGHFNNNIFEHPLYHQWLNQKLKDLSKIIMENQSNDYLNRQMALLEGIYDINNSIIEKDCYQSITKKIQNRRDSLKTKSKRKFIFGFVATITILIIIFEFGLNQKFDKNTYVFSKLKRTTPTVVFKTPLQKVEKKIANAASLTPPYDAIELSKLYIDHLGKYGLQMTIENEINKYYPNLVMRLSNNAYNSVLDEYSDVEKTTQILATVSVAEYMLSKQHYDEAEKTIKQIPKKKASIKDDLYHRLIHSYMGNSELKKASFITKKITDYDRKISHFEEINDLYYESIKDKMKTKGIIRKRLEHTNESRHVSKLRKEFIGSVRKNIDRKDYSKIDYWKFLPE